MLHSAMIWIVLFTVVFVVILDALFKLRLMPKLAAVVNTDAQGSGSHGDLLSPSKPELATTAADNTEVQASTSSVDPSPPSGYEYDVFLSFSGSDSGGFTDCLYHALVDAGIRTFWEESLLVGAEIGSLLEAIGESKVHLPIFSKSYASSNWCLRELTFMLERTKEEKHMIMPIYYDVTPTEVQDQTEDYGRALQKHEEEYGPGIVEQWKAALTEVGHLEGMDLLKLANGYQGQFIKLVVKVLKNSGCHADLSSPSNLELAAVVANVSTESQGSRSRGDSSPPSGYEYKVFLSFRGSDTGQGFTDCLYHALVDAGVRTFRDDESLRIGEEIDGNLLKAIGEANISIAIFSQSYASSKWCLKELTYMLKHWKKNKKEHMLLPVFYNVDPSEVRHQTGNYGRALQKHEAKYGIRIIEQWKAVLAKVSSFRGFNLDLVSYGHQGQLIKEIVSKVLCELNMAQPIHVTNNLVGIDDPVEDVKQLLQLGAHDVRIIGIWGTGGTGKTTLSKVIYNQIRDSFECSSFIKDIQETSRDNGVSYLQSLLVADILRLPESPRISCVYRGMRIIRDRCCRKKVLIVVDDVDRFEQLEALCIRHDYFGPGSRIIITTRNLSILDRWEVDNKYEVEAMDKDDALKLFCKHAFRRNTPTQELNGLSRDIVKTIGRLPLALEVIGSSLYGKNKEIWNGTLEKLKMVPDTEIQHKLKISFEALDHNAKEIFLDIACFFIGEDRRKIIPMWKELELFPHGGIRVLVGESLIKIGVSNEVLMQDQLRDLAKEIIREEDCLKPERRSRLWHSKDVKDVLANKRGTREVEAIRLDNEMESNPYVISGDQFEGLINLRYLDLVNAILVGDFGGKLSDLRWLGWHGRTDLQSDVPPSLRVMKLVVLDLSNSAVNDTWNGWNLLKEAERLEVVDLTGCHRLSRTPDFSLFPSIERLILRDCKVLEKIDSSIRHLTNLISLDVRNCSRLKSLPTELGSSLGQLKELLLDESSIEEIPINLGGLTNLETFSAKSCKSLRRIPKSIGSLVNMTKLLLDNCESLLEIDNAIGQLESLQELSLSCTKVMDLPNPIEKWSNLEVFNVENCPIRSLPSSLGKLTKLKEIIVSGCMNLKGDFPFALEHLTSLRILKLDHTNISSLPPAVDTLCYLQTLDLEGCMKLKSLPRLPTSLVHLKAAVASTAIPNLSELTNLQHLELQRHSNSYEHPTNDSPSSSSTCLYQHEVFLSFRGPDTRLSFTSELHAVLTREDIVSFIDSEGLEVGQKIDELLEAIYQSKISVTIFSKDYASSKWCLKEAAQIVKCMEAGRQQVYPIFYDVDPNEVRNQTGHYAEAFRKHEKSKKYDDNTIKEWRDALRKIASHTGVHFNTSNRSLGDVLNKVKSDISNKLVKSPHLKVTDDLVGIEGHIGKVMTKLDDDVNQVKMLGIWGMAGIGKTTIAKSIFNRFSSQFKHHSSLENLRGASLGSLQPFKRQLLSDISKGKTNFASHTDLHKGKKVLVLVDDVDTIEQLDCLVGKGDWFGSGSIIIVTTREEHVLLESNAGWIPYEVEPMHRQNAFLLFCKHAFQKDLPNPGFKDLSWEIVEATGRHPLAIKTIGCYLYSMKNKDAWEEARYILGTKTEIHDMLKITYDALNYKQQQIFLDIACLFNGADRTLPVHMWKAQKYLPVGALEVLRSRCLINIRDGNILWMHDLFIELGQLIVREESKYELRCQTRLWNSEDAIEVLERKDGAKEVKAIQLDCGSLSEKCCFSRENFEKISKLEFLRLGDANLDRTSNFEGCLSSLIWLSWHGRNRLDMPCGLRLKKLVILDLSKSMIEDDWNGWNSIKEAVNLEVLDLSGCHQLTKTPDFSSSSHMKRLILEDCQGLVEMGPSIGKLTALNFFNVKNCTSLKELPPEFGLLTALTELLLDGSSITGLLPISSDMKKLETISAKSCGSLYEIPPTIGDLESLKELTLSHTGVISIPESIANLSKLEVLNIDHCSVGELPQSLWELRQLKVINASGCRNLKGEISSELGKLKFLEVLRLDGTYVVGIPESIAGLSHLHILDLKNCTKLRSLPTLPSSLDELKVTLTSSVTVPNLPNLVYLKELEIVYCGELSQVLMDIEKFAKIKKLTISRRHTCRV